MLPTTTSFKHKDNRLTEKDVRRLQMWDFRKRLRQAVMPVTKDSSKSLPNEKRIVWRDKENF